MTGIETILSDHRLHVNYTNSLTDTSPLRLFAEILSMVFLLMNQYVREIFSSLSLCILILFPEHTPWRNKLKSWFLLFHPYFIHRIIKSRCALMVRVPLFFHWYLSVCYVFVCVRLQTKPKMTKTWNLVHTCLDHIPII